MVCVAMSISRPTFLACERDHERERELYTWETDSLVCHMNGGEAKHLRRRGYAASALFVGSSTSHAGRGQTLETAPPKCRR